MKKSLFVFGVCALTGTMALAGGNDEKKDEDRWKFGVSIPVAGPGFVEVDPGRVDYCYRCRDDFDALHAAFFFGYLLGNGAIDDGLFQQSLATRTLCCTATNEAFHARNNRFTGRPGDEYLYLAESRLNGVSEHGMPLSASLDYRAIGGLWASFSFAMSRETVVSVTEGAEFLRVTNIVRDDTYRPWGFPSTFYLDALRYRAERTFEHSQRFYTFSLLARYDLTRNDSRWSIIPQAGAEVMVARERTLSDESLSRYKIFAGEAYSRVTGTTWASRPEELESRTHTQVSWTDRLRPVAGVSVELYPFTKAGVLGLVADGRYRFNPDPEYIAYEHGSDYFLPGGFDSGRPVLLPYSYFGYPSDWTISVGALLRF